jgi:hypothetical protein
MIEIFLTIIIVYGITNILVFGTIFDGAKDWLKQLIELNRGLSEINPDDYNNLHAYISTDSLIHKYYEALDLINKNPTPRNVAEFEKIQQEINFLILSKKPKPHWILPFIEKLLELLKCPMCTGFWVGFFVVVLTTWFNIILFGLPITIVSASGLPWFISAFLMSCFYSGTCWIIYNIVEKQDNA